MRVVCWHAGMHMPLLAELSRMRGGIVTIDMAVLADLRPVPVEVCRKPTWLGGGLVVTMHFNKDWNPYTSNL